MEETPPGHHNSFPSSTRTPPGEVGPPHPTDHAWNPEGFKVMKAESRARKPPRSSLGCFPSTDPKRNSWGYGRRDAGALGYGRRDVGASGCGSWDTGALGYGNAGIQALGCGSAGIWAPGYGRSCWGPAASPPCCSAPAARGPSGTSC
uniref:Uncharacterized protein n=1 Tax=Amazona collaria TaxID=241587 RepID=A0A8B9G1V7_9PSIT